MLEDQVINNFVEDVLDAITMEPEGEVNIQAATMNNEAGDAPWHNIMICPRENAAVVVDIVEVMAAYNNKPTSVQYFSGLSVNGERQQAPVLRCIGMLEKVLCSVDIFLQPVDFGKYTE